MLEFCKEKTDEDLRLAYEYYQFLKLRREAELPKQVKKAPLFQVMDDRVECMPYE